VKQWICQVLLGYPNSLVQNFLIKYKDQTLKGEGMNIFGRQWGTAHLLAALAGIIVAPVIALAGSNVVITSFSANGSLTFSPLHDSDNLFYSVEWSPAVEGPWKNNWGALSDMVCTSGEVSVDVPMFYRIVADTERISIDTNRVVGPLRIVPDQVTLLFPSAGPTAVLRVAGGVPPYGYWGASFPNLGTVGHG